MVLAALLVTPVAACSAEAPRTIDTPTIEVGDGASSDPEPEGAEVPAKRAVDDAACREALFAGEGITTGDRDEELFREGIALRPTSPEQGRKRFFELIDNHKRSPFLPLAYLQFAELYAGEANETPSKWELAAHLYQEVLKYPAPANRAWALAALRLAIAETAKGDTMQALDHLKQTIDATRKYPDPCAEGIAEEARTRLVPLYAAVGSPQQAYAFFKPLSGDDARLALMLVDLARALAPRNPSDAAAVLDDLLARPFDRVHCDALRTLATEPTIQQRVGTAITNKCI
jgi:hypothetical protein